jgi:hypothetical protein
MVKHDVADRKSLDQVRDADLPDGVMNDLSGDVIRCPIPL